MTLGPLGDEPQNSAAWAVGRLVQGFELNKLLTSSRVGVELVASYCQG